ncbi:hypothetical protein CKAH01_14665 [Colletotrichum kahawae]|uniref:Uncharacterized protein n=1 Tax=Colletotrichum kahawae TaxID=34407 RepID=A0AAD9YMX2_COLKA|nr:hypothetical protein CKAH01_14665 [Colletotrichum kahawae]
MLDEHHSSVSPAHLLSFVLAAVCSVFHASSICVSRPAPMIRSKVPLPLNGPYAAGGVVHWQTGLAKGGEASGSASQLYLPGQRRRVRRTGPTRVWEHNHHFFFFFSCPLLVPGLPIPPSFKAG